MAREVPGKSLKAAFTKGSTNSAPLAFHKHQQHSMNFLSAKSPPAARSGLTSFIDSPRDRLSSASIALSTTHPAENGGTAFTGPSLCPGTYSVREVRPASVQ